MKITSTTYSAGPAGSTLVQSNVEGTVTAGFGTAAGTGTFVGGKSGTFSYCGMTYMENGELLGAGGQGSYESVGAHSWATSMVLHLSDGRAMLSEGRIDLAGRSWDGTVYEWT